MRRYIRLAGIVVLAMAVPALAVAQLGTLIVSSGGGLSFGDGATVTTQPDGFRVADNGHRQKRCLPDDVAVAATVPITIVNVDGSKTFNDGVVACLDLGNFNGGIAVSMEARITLRPAK